MTADQGFGFGQRRRPKWRDMFLATMEQIVPGVRCAR